MNLSSCSRCLPTFLKTRWLLSAKQLELLKLLVFGDVQGVNVCECTQRPSSMIHSLAQDWWPCGLGFAADTGLNFPRGL